MVGEALGADDARAVRTEALDGGAEVGGAWRVGLWPVGIAETADRAELQVREVDRVGARRELRRLRLLNRLPVLVDMEPDRVGAAANAAFTLAIVRSCGL